MKRLVAEFLRHRTVWQLVAIAALFTIAGLLLIYNVYSSTLKQLGGVLVLLFGTAGAALFMAVVRCAEQVAAHGEAARRWRNLATAVLGIAAFLAFATYSLGHHGRQMVASCNAALLPSTLAERQAAQERAEAQLWSPFALLPWKRRGEAVRECARGRADLARVEQGLCTAWTIDGLACVCGPERYPLARCPSPRCLVEPGLPDHFDCPGDPIPVGYSRF